jgi:hypothetical protein
VLTNLCVITLNIFEINTENYEKEGVRRNLLVAN